MNAGFAKRVAKPTQFEELKNAILWYIEMATQRGSDSVGTGF
jgi:hypothetical protein